MSMKYALIAAGRGSRLAEEGIAVPKPLVRVNGEELMGRLMRLFVAHGAEAVGVVVNEEMTEVHRYLQALRLPVPLHVVVKTTPTSLHSFFELLPWLKQGGGRFCLTTVDPIFKESEFANYVRAFQTREDLDALMAVTRYVDDEKPLYVMTRPGGLEIAGYGNAPQGDDCYVSGGVYCMGQRALDLLPQAMAKGVERMRGFQKYMVEQGLKMQAWPFSKVIDVDHAADVAKAEQLLGEP